MLNVPVDHHAAPAVAHVQLRHEVLIPGAKLFRVRGVGRSPLTPDVRMSDTKDGVSPTKVRKVPQDSSQLPWRKGFSAIPELPRRDLV